MKIGVVVPIYKEYFDECDRISLKCLFNHLHNYDLIAICPTGLNADLAEFIVRRYDDLYFASIANYSRLLLSKQFYESFKDYDYILVYQLDCLVFSSDLDYWCNQGYDYIGAPLLTSINDTLLSFSRVGNGGLSLRRVASFLRVLNADLGFKEIPSLFNRIFCKTVADLGNLTLVDKMMKKVRIYRQVMKGVEWYTNHYTLNEDLFWSDRARMFDSTFNIAPVQTALQFSFDLFPRYCFKKNRLRLPFGCHGWFKNDRQFWERYIQ